jgi:FtsP/CotA-like multicopper oxidase with cupredoxin domain
MRGEKQQCCHPPIYLLLCLSFFFLLESETQLWQIVNLGADTYFNVEVEQHGFTVVETDGSMVWKTYELNELFLIQGRRFGVVIQASMTPGTYEIRSNGYNGGRFANYPPVTLGYLKVEGSPDFKSKAVKIPHSPGKPPSWLNSNVSEFG